MPTARRSPSVAVAAIVEGGGGFPPDAATTDTGIGLPGIEGRRAQCRILDGVVPSPLRKARLNSNPRFPGAIWPALCVLAALGGCAASTQTIVNDKASAEIKAKSYRDYKEILFIPPKEDPRTVVPRTVQALEAMGFKVRVMDPEKPIEAAQGTAFLIGADGQVLTCAHVLDGETAATVFLDGKRYVADVLKADKTADLALLKLRDKPPEGAAVLSFRAAAKGYSMGEDVFTIGYPLSSLLGNSARMSKGLVSATAGMRDNPKQLQVSAEIQPGNSGGPLLDRDGQVVGIVQQTLNPWRLAQATGGALPQNVNFAIKADAVLDFVQSASPETRAALRFDQAGGLDRASHSVAKILAGIVPDDDARRSKMVVRLNYLSIWDVWYRFRFFVLSAFDFDSQEPLFVTGQGRDNLISNEDVVMKDTFEQFRKAVNSR
jgi:serine protease Do